MRKNILLTFILASLLVLSGCSTSYGEFTLVKDSESAKTVFEDYKLKNKNVEILAVMEGKSETTGFQINENGEEISVNTSCIFRSGIQGTKYAFDCISKNESGTYVSNLRFDEKTQKYYNFSALNLSYEKNDVEVKVDSSTLTENEFFNRDPIKVYTVENLPVSYFSSILSETSYSTDINIYTSDKGYMKCEEKTSDGNTYYAIFDKNGYATAEKYWYKDVTIDTTYSYNVDFEDVNIDDYEKRSDAYAKLFSTYVTTFYSFDYQPY